LSLQAGQGQQIRHLKKKKKKKKTIKNLCTFKIGEKVSLFKQGDQDPYNFKTIINYQITQLRPFSTSKRLKNDTY